MNVIMFAAQYVANDSGVLVGALLMALLIVAGVAVITVGAILYVKDGSKPAAVAPAAAAAEEPARADSEATGMTEPTEETATETAEETATEEPSEATADDVTDESAAEEEAIAEEEPAAEETTSEPGTETAEETADEPAEEAATEEAADEIAATTDGAVTPTFIDDIMAGLSDGSKETFSYRVIGRNYGAMNTMKDVRDYATEGEFLDDFFKNANRFYKPFNAEIFTALYERQKPNKRGNELSKLNVRYANALYYYRKDDPTLVGKTIMLLKDDVEYQLSKDITYLKKVPSLKKLILIYSSRGEYDEAIAYCDRAIEHKIYDVRQSGFEPRRKALVEKRDRAEARKARAAKKLAANNSRRQ